MFASLNPGHIGIKTDLSAGLAMAGRHGFGGYDAPLSELHAVVEARGVSAAEDLFFAHGLRVGAWNLPFNPCAVSHEDWSAGIEKLATMLPSADRLGARRAAMWVFSGSNEREYEENFEFHVQRYGPIAALLADHGIRLGLEFLGPLTIQRRFRFPFIRSIPEITRLAEAVSPDGGLLLDSWHWYTAGSPREDLSGLDRTRIVHVHVNDAPPGIPLDEQIDNQRRLPCTTGEIDLDGFMQALATKGYDGPVTAEPFDRKLHEMADEEAVAFTARTTRSAVARAVSPEKSDSEPFYR